MAWRTEIWKPRRWVAERLGVSPKTVDSWEYGTRDPGGPALWLIRQLMAKLPRGKAHE
jgi:DNA-binding transcriptional regulator YiaG